MALLTRNSVVYANGRFVIPSSSGYLSHSSDGITWQTVNIGTTNSVNSVAYGAGYYVAVCTGGVIARSADLTNWTSVTLTGNTKFNSVVFAASKFVAVGSSGRVYTSTTGSSWTLYSSGTTSDLTKIRYLNSIFIAIGIGGTLITSTNGTAWTLMSVDTRPLYTICHNPTSVIPYTTGKKYSLDGVTWKSVYQTSVYLAQRPLVLYPAYWTSTAYYQYRSYVAYASNVDDNKADIFPSGTGYIRGGLGGPGYGGGRNSDMNSSNPDNVSPDTTGVQFGEQIVSSCTPTVTTSWPTWTTTGQGTQTVPSYDYPFLHTTWKSLGDPANTIIIGMYLAEERGYRSYETFASSPPQGGQTRNFIHSTKTIGSGGLRFDNPYGAGYAAWTNMTMAAYGNGTYMYIGLAHDSYRVSSGTLASRGWYYQVVCTRSTPMPDAPGYLGAATKIIDSYAPMLFPLDLGEGPPKTLGNPQAPTTDYPLYQCELEYGLGRFIACGPRQVNTSLRMNSTSDREYIICHSADNGVNWTVKTFPESRGYYVGGKLAATATEAVFTCRWYNNGTPGYVMRTTDMVNYTYHFAGYNAVVTTIKRFTDGYYYCTFDNGGISRSADGITWVTLVPVSETAIMGYDLKDIAYINGTYVLTSNNGYYQTSTNLGSWTTYTSGGATNFILNDGSKLVSCGYDASVGGYAVKTSTDGVNWVFKDDVIFTDMAFGGTKYIGISNVPGDKPKYSSDLVVWMNSDLSNKTGTGIIINDSFGRERLQTYDSSATNYLCTRVVQEDYCGGSDATFYVNGADGYQVFYMVTPDGTNAAGMRLPKITEHRGAAPTYQPYYTVTYPAYGGAGSPPSPAPVFITVFTTGVKEQRTY